MWQVSDFGKTKSGIRIFRYTAKNQQGTEVSVITYGASIQAVKVADRTGNIEDVVAGYDDASGYEAGTVCFGGSMGRCTNRIGRARFTIDGMEYKLPQNDGDNSIHGGLQGFHKRIWEAEVEGDSLMMSYTSCDLEEGYPGEVKVKATFQLQEDNELFIDYSAITDKPTIVNMTNHAGYNLSGDLQTTVLDHLVKLNADKFTPKDDTNVPTGEIGNVQGTIFDLRQPTSLGSVLDKVPGDIGFDHNYCVNRDDMDKTHVASLYHEGSGRTLDAYSNQPGVHLYTGHYIMNEHGKAGRTYPQYSSVAFETQNYPDAANKANFPSCVLRPGQTYNHQAWFKFGVKSK